MPETTETPTQARNRVVAIVGRPNVGKSALFNRLVGRRVAIVHEESGVTRDRLVCEVNGNHGRFSLIDTGGIGRLDAEDTPDVIEAGTREQVDVAIEDAGVLVLVVDITAGIVPLDEEVARILHEAGRPVVCAVNKADNHVIEKNASEFAALGYPLIPVSALHNRGIEDLLDAVAEHLPEPVDEAEIEPLRVAVVGRPNVGKSSYINRLLNNERVIVSEVPGTTRDSIEVPFAVGKGPSARHYTLVDTAGVRKQGRVKNAVEQFSMMRTEKSIETVDLAILMLDASQGPTARDKRIAASILENEKGCFILVNKWDLAQEDEITQTAYGKAMSKALPFLGFVPVLFTSAKSGYNIRKTLEAIDYVGSQIRAKLSTGVLNRVLRDAFDKVSPPMVKGKRLKLFYATQVGTEPVRVRLYVNDPRNVPSAYQKYLDHALRRAFGLEGAPIVLQFKRKTGTEKA